jgi:hypothetical protein
LRQRGSITFWLDETAINNWWHNKANGRHCRDLTYIDQAIQTFLMIQAIYGLSLRQTQGFIDSLFGLMSIPLQSPGYSCVSKRAKTVNIRLNKTNGTVAHNVLDATELRVYDEGEWKVRRHGADKRRTWRKLHLGIDTRTQHIICAEQSLESVGDNEVLPVMLNKLRRKIDSVSGDGAYDARACYGLWQKKALKLTSLRAAMPVFGQTSTLGTFRSTH